jgi:CRISPR/Cas system-associated endonuclease/helicase Cas3
MKKTKKSSTYRLDEVTRERVKELAREFEHSEAEVIQLLVDSYYKLKVIENDDGNWEFKGFYETT